MADLQTKIIRINKSLKSQVKTIKVSENEENSFNKKRCVSLTASSLKLFHVSERSNVNVQAAEAGCL